MNKMSGNLVKFTTCAVFLFCAGSGAGRAQENCQAACDRPLKLQSYEPNTVGYTFDSNDVAYLDFTLSQMYPLFHSGTADHNTWGGFPFPYFAFSGRFGQYIGTRNSSPVLGKRFNPKLFGRYWLGSKNRYLDFGYAHESNGQKINSETSYLNLRSEFANDGEQEYFANDYLSRGWDYLELVWKDQYAIPQMKTATVSSYLQARYFLADGLLQGEPEEVNTWETDARQLARSHVDGLSIMVKASTKFTEKWFEGYKLTMKYTTGYEHVFRYNTYRVEATLNLGGLPLMFWAADGYNSDLSDYSTRVRSVGISFEMRNRLDQI